MVLTINQLPPEILGEIFLHCLPASTQLQGGDPALHRIPHLLTNVCKLWYTLTHALPTLWASLHITCDSYSAYPCVAAIGTHLQRSSTHPLTFSLNALFYQHFLHNATPSLPGVLTALATARERWKCAIITLSAAPQAVIDAITQGPAPLLQTFHCKLIEPNRPLPASIPLHVLQMCPRLESLAWIGFYDTPLHPLGDSTWPHLTFLRLEASLSITDCLTLLRLSPCLSIAEFSDIVLPPRPPYLHLAHHTLHTLHAGGSYVTALLDALTLPTLAHLQLDPFPVMESSAHSLHTFLIRNAPLLCTLTLNNMQLPEPELLNILALTPILHTLTITGRVRLTAVLVRALHPGADPGSAVLCPRLCTLHLSGLECLDGICGAMLRARWGADALLNGVAVLKQAKIELRGTMHHADYEAMHELCEEGMVGELSSGFRG